MRIGSYVVTTVASPRVTLTTSTRSWARRSDGTAMQLRSGPFQFLRIANLPHPHRDLDAYPSDRSTLPFGAVGPLAPRRWVSAVGISGSGRGRDSVMRNREPAFAPNLSSASVISPGLRLPPDLDPICTKPFNRGPDIRPQFPVPSRYRLARYRECPAILESGRTNMENPN